jgi:hypothetical protein
MGDAVVVRGEALVRLEAERRMLKIYKSEYQGLTRRVGHVGALCSLVKDYKESYNALLRQVRAEREPSKLIPPAEGGSNRAA